MVEGVDRGGGLRGKVRDGDRIQSGKFSVILSMVVFSKIC